MTEAEKVICRLYLEDTDKNHTCNEYKLLMGLLDKRSCEDAISRAEVHDLLATWIKDQQNNDKTREILEVIDGKIEDFPSVNPMTCEDAISRQAAENITWNEPSYTDALNVLTEVRDKIRALPFVTPKQRTGHWKCFVHSAYHGVDEDGEPIWREVKVYYCDKCNRRTVIMENFCPSCGASMESEE